MPVPAVGDRRVRPDLLPLTAPQRRLWFLYRLEGPGGTDNVPMAVRLSGRLDHRALGTALRDVLVRQAALRTVFREVDGTPYQEVVPEGRADVALEPAETSLAGLAAAVADAARGRFDLSSGLPVRARLFQMSADDHVLLMVMHQIAADAWSLGPLGRDLGAAYTARCAGRAPRWAPWPEWQTSHVSWRAGLARGVEDGGGPDPARAEYWKSVLTGLPTELALPADRARPAISSYRAGSIPLSIDARLHAQLFDVARQGGTTLSIVIHAALAALLTRLGAGTDIPVGLPVSGRPDEAVDQVVGCLASALVLRADTSGDPGFRDLLGRVREASLGACAHRDVPFEYLVEVLGPVRSMARHPLFQVMLELEEGAAAASHFRGLAAEPVPVQIDLTRLDLSFRLGTRCAGDGAPGGLAGELTYSADLFDRGTAEMLASCLARLLAAVAARPDMRIGDLDILSAAERDRMLMAGRGRDSGILQAGVAGLFREQASRSPDAVALASGDSVLTYRELDERASRLARYLRRRGVGPDARVALYLEPGAEMVTGLLAIMAAGGAYVPLDPHYPVERTAFMLQDSGAMVVLTLERLRDRLSGDGQVVISIDTGWEAGAGEIDGVSLPAGHPASLAYVMYTSGSTGTPKGVAITHRNVVNLISDQCWRSGNYGRVLFHSPYSFDASTFELWVPLLSGGQVMMVTERRVAVGDLEQAIAEKDVTAAYFTTALFELMAQEAMGGLSRLREIWTGGDVLSPVTMQQVLDACPGTTVMHAYGPTETTVFCSFQMFGVSCRDVAVLTLGGSMDNTKMYLLDGRLRLAPPGVEGNLYLAGAGLAREYLNRPGLTAARFVADPFGEPGARMYQTGDVARRTAAGGLVFCGRADDQVKVRGFRVEPGEVEAVLSRHPAVGQVVVAAREDRPGDKRLVAFVVSAAGTTAEPGALRRFARDRMPEHMVPSLFAVVDRLPLTPNGKLDRRALSTGPVAQGEPKPEHVAPRSRAEEAVARAWSEVLGTGPVGVHDNFFSLGGDSFCAVQVVSRLQALFRAEIPVRIIFQAQTIAELVGELRNAVARKGLRSRTVARS